MKLHEEKGGIIAFLENIQAVGKGIFDIIFRLEGLHVLNSSLGFIK